MCRRSIGDAYIRRAYDPPHHRPMQRRRETDRMRNDLCMYVVYRRMRSVFYVVVSE